MFYIENEKTDNEIVIKINGNATIQNIEKINENFNENLSFNKIIIDLRNITEVDFSFVQILVLFYSYCLSNKLLLVIKDDYFPQNLNNLVIQLGFDRLQLKNENLIYSLKDFFKINRMAINE